MASASTAWLESALHRRRSGLAPRGAGLTRGLLARGLFALGLFSTGLLARPAAAEESFAPPAEPRRLLAVRTAEAIALDGELSETAWAAASPASGFIQIDPREGEPAERDTEVRLLYDQHALYLGIVCHDEAGRGGVRVQDLRRDFNAEQNDYVAISFDPFRDGRTAQIFAVHPLGAQRDLRVTDDSLNDLDWDAVWRVRTRIGERGWTAEIEIPWSSLRYPAGSQVWGMNVGRQVRRLAEISAWSPWPRGMSLARMTYAGVVEGLEPPPPARNLRLQPYLLARAEQVSGEDGRREDEDFELGGELKWLPGPSTVVDATVNTDFAQADVDRQVVNLSRFSVFFPERRPFFLENAGLFDSDTSAIKPFFSRRIGLDEGGRPLPIDAGLRWVHQNSERSFGALAVRTGAEGESPASSFALARFSENLGSRHRLGALVVARQDELAGGDRTNTVAMVDGLYRPHELFTLQGFLSGSTTSGEGGDGVAGNLWLYSKGPRGYFGFVERFVSEDYEPGAGFVSRKDYLLTSPALTLDWRPAWLPKAIRQLKPNASLNLYHAFSDLEFQEGNGRLEPLWVVFQDGSEVWAWWSPTWQRLDQPFSPLPGLEVAPGAYDRERWGLAGATDRSRRYGLELRHEFGGYYDGELATTNLTARAVVSPRASLVLSWEHNELTSLGAGRDGRTTDLVSPELRLALDPQKQLSVVYQHNDAAELSTWFARLSWEIRSLSYLYVVYNDNAPTDPERGFLGRPEGRDRQLVVKLNWLWQW